MHKNSYLKFLSPLVPIIFLVFSCYFLYHYTFYKTPLGSYIGDILLGIKDLSIFFIFIIASYSIGIKLIKLFLFNLKSYIHEAFLALGLGFSFYYILALIISILHMLSVPLLWATLIIPIICSLKELANLFYNCINKYSLQINFTDGFLFLIFVLYFIFALSPPCGIDSLVYHLVMPQEYLEHGGIPNSFSTIHCHLPSAMSMLYLYLMGLGSDFLPQLLHYFFFLIICGLSYINIKNLFSSKIAKYAILLFACEFPVVQHGIQVANVDFHTSFYCLASFFILINIFYSKDKNYSDNKKNWLILSGIFLATAMSSKYTAYQSLFATEVLLIILILYKKLSFKHYCLFNIVTFIAFSPVLIKNYIYTGDPLFWLLSQNLHAYNIIPKDIFFANKILNQYGGMFSIEKSVQTFFMAPFYVYFYGKFPSVRFDGFINPFYILSLFLGIFFLKKNKILRAFYIYLAVFYIVWFRTPIVRYALPIFPILSLITIFCFDQIISMLKNLKIRIFFEYYFNFIIILFCSVSLLNFVCITKNRYSLGMNLPTFFRINPKENYLKYKIPDVIAFSKYINDISDENNKTFMIFENRSYYIKNKKSIYTESFYGTNMAILNLKDIGWKNPSIKGPDPLKWLKKRKFRFILVNESKYKWLFAPGIKRKSFLPPNEKNLKVLRNAWDYFHHAITPRLIKKAQIGEFAIYEIPNF